MANVKAIMALAATAAFVVPIAAGAVTVTNGSFETPVVTGNFDTYGSGDSTLTGWSIDSGSIDHIGSLWEASEGNQSVDLSGSSAATISQTLTGLSAGVPYELSFDLAGNPDGGSPTKSVDVNVAVSGSTFAFDTNGQSRSDMGWVTQSLTFTPGGNSATLSFASNNDSVYGPALDNVSVAPIPVPAAGLLLGFAVGVLGLFGRRRNAASA